MSVPVITITGLMQNFLGAADTGALLRVRLVVPSGSVPRVAGTSIIVDLDVDPTLPGDGTFSFTPWGTDVLLPGPNLCYYVVTFIPSTGGVSKSIAYQFTGSGSFDLSNLAPFNPPVPLPPAPPNAVVTNPSGTQVITGFPLVSAIDATVLNDNRVFVDRYPSWAAALAALPAAGGILDATSVNAPRAMGTFDPGARQVTVLFGPYTYNANQIVLRAGLQLLGMSAATNCTVIQSVGSNATPLLVNPAVTNSQVFNVKIDGIRFLAAVSNTSQEGLLSDVSATTNSNLNYCQFSNLWFVNFVGSAIHLKGRPNDALAANQFLLFQNVNALRVSGINPVLKIEGYAGQIHFDSCEFDGASANDGGDNIYIGSGGGTNSEVPNTIFFDNVTSQGGSVGIHVDGGQGISIRGLHSEGCAGVLLVSNSSSGINVTANPLIHLYDSDIVATSAVNSGNGYVLKVTDTTVIGPKVVLENNVWEGTPDNIIINANTNNAVIISRNNFSPVSPSGVAPTTNVTQAQTPTATLNIYNWDHVLLTTSATSITTLRGSHLPGEVVTFVASGGTIQFASGGNLNLGANSSPLIVKQNDSVTFRRADLGNFWHLMAYSPGGGNAVQIGSQLVTAVQGNTAKAQLASSFTNGNFFSADVNGNTVDSAKAVPAGAVVGTTDTQTLTGKTIGAGGLLGLSPNQQIFTSSGTFTIPAGITAVKVTVVAGGGAGGGSSAANNGGGGGAGGTGIKWLSGLTPGNTLTVTVGLGGTGVSNATGNAGGASSVASGTQTITTISTNGGGGAGTGAGGGFGGGFGAAGSGGDLNLAGNGGGNAAGTVWSGGGGGSIFGGGGSVTGAAGTSTVGGAPGAGGSGAFIGATAAGGAGANGIVIFEWVK